MKYAIAQYNSSAWQKYTPLIVFHLFTDKLRYNENVVNGIDNFIPIFLWNAKKVIFLYTPSVNQSTN